MAEENNELVNLGDLSSASSADIRKALEGQPNPVESGEDPSVEEPEQIPEDSSLPDLGVFESSLVKGEDGNFTFQNPFSTNLGVDLDKYETRRRRVSEGSMLSGVLNGVEGLEQNFVYTGLEDTAKRSAEAQGVVNKMKNGVTQLVTDTSLNVAQGFSSLLYGVPSAIVNGDLTKLYDNNVANFLDRGAEALDEFYEIKRGGDQSGVQKAANFVFDDLFGGASFVMGAIATELAFSALTAATFGGAAPAQAAATAGLVARGTRLAQKALQGGKSLVAGNLVDDALRGARGLTGRATREAATSALQTAAASARNPMAMQAAARVSRQLITGASMESGMEARHMLNAAVENQKRQHEELFGEGTFTEEMADGFREQISGYADGVFGTNMALVGASNMLMFPKLFGVGLRRGMRTGKFIDTSKLTAKARTRLAKNLGVPEGALPKLIDASRGNTFGRIVGRTGQTGRVTVRNMKNALYEGFVEEGGQGAISRSTEDYIAKRYDPKGVDQTVKFTESFLEGLKGSYTTKDGFKEIGIGMLLAFTGVPMYARSRNTEAEIKDGKPKYQWQMMGGYADQRRALMAEDRRMQAIVDLNEKSGDVNGILTQEIQNFHRQNVLQQEQDIAIQEGRFKDAKDIESEQIFSHAAAKVTTGRFDQALGEAKQVMDEMSNDEFREMYGEAGKNMTDVEVEARKSQIIESHKARMERARDAYEIAGDVYRGEDPDIHTGVAHMVYMAKEKDTREKAIAEEMAELIEGMNGGKVLDLVRAQADLDMTDAQLGEILTRINRNKDIEKQLQTKLERNLIKNVDPEKSERRQREVEALQEEQQENLDFMQNMMDTMATAQNVNRNKYDFNENFLQDLATLHSAITEQNAGVEFREKDLEQLADDLRGVAADRFALIAAYNDFISPGGVQRFEANMIGSIEALAKMDPNERQAKKQLDAAREEDIESRAEKTQAVPEDDVTGQPPADDGSGAFGVPTQADVDNFGFPDPTPPGQTIAPEVPNVDAPPAGTDLESRVPTEDNQPVATQEPARSSVGKIVLNLTNPRTKGDRPNGELIPAQNQDRIARVLKGIPVGTKLRLTETGRGVEVQTTDGMVLDTVSLDPRNGRYVGDSIANMLRTTNGPIDVVTTSAIDPTTGAGMNFRGGELVVKNENGVRVVENEDVNRRIREVLPSMSSITGYAVTDSDGNLISFLDPDAKPLKGNPNADERFAGNTYISTTDSVGESAWHTVQLEQFGQKRAQQMLDTVAAYNQFVTNENEMTPEQISLLQSFFEARGIDSSLKGDELLAQVLESFRRMIRSNTKQTQRKKLGDAIRQGKKAGPFFYISPIGNTSMISINAVQQNAGKIETQESFDESGNTQASFIRNHLADATMNVVKENRVVPVADGKGNYTGMMSKDMIAEFGSFSNRMPLVVNGKQYNLLPDRIEITVEQKTPIPTGEVRSRVPESQVTQTETGDLFIDTSALDGVDLNNLDFGENLEPSYLIDADATNPMDRAGVMYDVPGLTSRQLRDGVNFGAGIMSRAFVTHMRTVDRYKTVSADYLRRTMRAQLEAQLANLEARPQNQTTKLLVEAHKAYLDPKNFDRLVDLSMVEMLQQSQGIIQLRKGSVQDAMEQLGQTQSTLQENEQDDKEMHENPMATFDENYAFGVDPKSTMRMELKMLIMSLQHSSKNPKGVGLAGPRFMNSKDLSGKMSAVLAGVSPKYDAVEARLREYVGTYPEFATVLDALTDTSALESLPPSVRENKKIQQRALGVQDMIRNQFVSFAVKESTTFDTVQIIAGRESMDDFMQSRSPEIKIWNSNSRNMREHVKNDMRSILQQRGFFDVNGQPQKEKFAELSREIDAITRVPKPDQAKALQKLLKEQLGIEVPVQALTSQNETRDSRNRKIFQGIEVALANPNSGTGGFGRFKYAVRSIAAGNVTIEQLLSDKGDSADRQNKVGKNFVEFFVALADYRENFIQNSSKDGDNKTRYQFGAPKLLHQMLRKVQKEPGNTLLGSRVRKLNVEDQGVIGLSYLDGIKSEKGSVRNFHGMEPGDSLIAELGLYANRNEYRYGDMGADKPMISKFLMPTLADKKTMPILQMPAKTAREIGLVVNPDIANKPWRKLQFRDFVPDVGAAFAQSSMAQGLNREADRIVRIAAGNTEGMTAAQRQAVGFVTMPALNGLAQQMADNKIKPAEFRRMVLAEGVRVFEAAMDADLQDALEVTKGTVWDESTGQGDAATLGKLNHFHPGKKDFTSRAMREHLGLQGNMEQGGMHLAGFAAFVAKYNYDSLDAKTGLIFDVMGDPGAFVKLNKEGKIDVNKTAKNLGKRLAAFTASGAAIPIVDYKNEKGVTVSNGTVNFLVIPNREVDKAEHYDYLQKLGQTPDELASQEGYDSADAAEYTTVAEHLGILYARGEITRPQMDGLMKAIYVDKRKLEKAEMAWFQPMKPVTTGRVGDHTIYVKSASFPLIPGLTQGTELDKLRVFMEDNGIQRAAFESAMKIGNEWDSPFNEMVPDADKMVPVFEGNTVVIDEVQLNQRVIRGVDRSFMRIQQEVPVSKAKEKVHGSQVAKQILVDLGDAQFELDGEPLSGTALYDKYLSARQDEIDARLQVFVDKYGLRLENGAISHTPESRQKLGKKMLDEAIARNYDANEIAHLHQMSETGEFSTPLEGGPSQKRLENLLKAVIFKEVYHPRIEGFSGPIRPEVGMRTLDDAEVDKSNIMWVKRKGKRIFNGKLGVARGKGTMDQIIMPWKYKASLEKFMDEDGNINAEDLPPELLKTFAYRIPSQRKSSSVAFEIVGFLPEEYGDTLIVNEELVGRIGQDYDIDKMFGFLYAIKQADDGTITVTRDKKTAKDRVDSARNAQVDIYIASMAPTDAAIEQAIHAPVTDGYGVQLAEQLNGLRSEDIAGAMPMSRSYNRRKADAARNAKSSIEVFASQSVLHSQLEQALSLTNKKIGYLGKDAMVTILASPDASAPTENTRFGERGIHDDTFLLEYTDKKGRPYTPKAGNRSEQFSRLLNHAVDNENNGLLDRLGITRDTWPIWTGMTHMGYNQETAGLLVSMPSVQHYLKMKSGSRRLLDNGRIEIGDAFTDLFGNVKPDDVVLNKEDMLAIVKGTTQLSESEQQAMNYAALVQVAKLEAMSEDMQRIQRFMKLDNSRPKSVLGVQVLMAEMRNVMLSKHEGNILPVKEVAQVTGTTVSGQVTSLVSSTFSSLFNLDNNLLPQSTITRLVADLRKAEHMAIEDKVIQLVDGAKSQRYAVLTENLMGKTAQEVREEAHNIKTGGIAQRLVDMRKTKPEIESNMFIRQLVAINEPGQYPHLEFPGDRQLESNSLELQRAFLNLLKSTDPEVREFAKELVGYALATSGGRLKSRGYLKFVPAEYLQANGLADVVNSQAINNNLLNNARLTEIIRHNPQLAPRYTRGTPAYRNAVQVIDGQLHIDASSPNLRGHVRLGNKLYAPLSEKPLVVMQDNMEMEVYPIAPVTELGTDYLSDEYNSEPLPANHLPTKRKMRTTSFALTQDAPPNLHNEQPGEYNPTLPEGMVLPPPPTMVPTDSSRPSGFEVPSGVPSNMGLGSNPKQTVNDRVVRTEDKLTNQRNDFRTFLKKTTLKGNPLLETLASTQDSLPLDQRVTVVVKEGMEDKGMYDPNTRTIFLRPDQVNNQRTVTHEAMHAVTQLGIEIYEGNLKEPDARVRQKVRDAADNIDRLFKVATSPQGLKDMGLTNAGLAQARRGFRALQRQMRGEEINRFAQQDIDFLRANLDDYYGLMNLKEFVAESFSNEKFAARLENIEIDTGFVARFVAAIEAIIEAMGINIAEKGFLRDVYTQTMGLVDVQTQGGITAVNDLVSEDLPASRLIDNVLGQDTQPYRLEGVDSLAAYKKKRIRQFDELKSRYKDNREFVRRVEARLVQERTELARLTDDSVEVTPDYLLSIGQRELEFARRTIDSVNATDPEIGMALSALQNVYSVVEFYDQSRDILKDPALKDVATELRREASELRDNYLDKARVVLRQDAMREFEGKGVDVNAATFETLQQTGFLSSTFMDASRQGTTELSYLDKIVRDSAQQARVRFNERAKAYMDVSKKFKRSAYFIKHGWNGMVELDADNNPTPKLLTMLSGRYESEYRVKQAELGNTKAFYDWKNSVTERIDVDSIFDYSGDTVVRKNNPKYEAYLENKFGKYGAQEFLRQQEIMLQDYIDLRTSEFDIMELTLGENAPQAKALWELKNNPKNAYRRAKTKKAGPKGSTARFLLDMPLQTVKGESTGYYDARFDELQADPDALAFYNEYRKQMKEMMAMLPAHKMTGEHHLVKAGLFLPAITKSMTNDLLTKNGFMDAVTNLPANVKAALTIDPEYDINKLIDPVTGKPRQELPVYFMGQVDPEQQDYDLDNTFLAFAMMATTYDSKNAIEDKVRMTKSVMGSARVARREGNLDKVLNYMGMERAPGYNDDASRATTMKSVDTVVDTFYGYQSKVDPTVNAPRKLWTKEQTEEIEDLERQLMVAETQEDKDALEQKIQDATPQMSGAKTVRGMQQFVQAKGMAWNVPAAIVNMIFGSISVFKHSAGRADFGEAEARRATGIMMHSSLNNMTLNTGATQTGTALKIQNMMINFDVLKDFTEMRYDVRKFVKQAGEAGVNQAVRQGFNKLRMYEIQRSSEYFVYGQGVVAVLLNEKVGDKSLWELMGEDGVIDIDGYRPGEQKHTDLMNKIDQMNKRIHGNYDPNSPIAVKKTLFGPLIMQFRSWLPEAVATRFETEKYDPHLDRMVKGTYRTMFSAEFMRNFKAMMPMLLPSWARTKGMDTMNAEISEVDQENIRKFGASLRQYLQVMILISVLRALKDDEDDEESVRMLNFGLNIADRVENDLALFGRPGAFLDMTQGDFMAVVGFMSDVEKFGEATIKTAQGDGMIETGVYAGETRMWHHFQKLVPHLGAVQRISNNLDRELSTS